MTDVVVGLVSGLHGVQGALKIKSFCEPAEGIFKYRPWTLARPALVSSPVSRASKFAVNIAEMATTKATSSGDLSLQPCLVGVPLKIRGAGTSLAARFPDIEDRDQAALWLGALISVPRSCLPKLNNGDYYWRDLIGLKVKNLQGVTFGVIEEMMATGSNDVMVLSGDRQRLLPYIPGQFVMNVDLAAGEMIVDWDPEF